MRRRSMLPAAASTAHDDLTRARTGGALLSSTLAWRATVVVVLIAPFEALDPVIRLPWQSVSDVELAIAAAVGAWALSVWASRNRRWWRTPLSAPLAVLLLAMSVAAMLAPAWRVNAAHATARIAAAAAVFLMTVDAVATPRRAAQVMAAAALAGTVVASLVILEFAGVASVLDALRPFRAGVSRVGEQLRAAGPLQYPTIASMYLEMTFAFALGLLVGACDARRRVVAAAWVVALAVMGEADVLTFARAGLLTAAAAVALVAAMRLRLRGARDDAFRLALLVGSIVAVEATLSHSAAASRLRLTSEAQASWYRAAIAAPASLTLSTGSTIAIPVRVANTGRIAWDPRAVPPFRLSYHWVTADGDWVVAYEGERTAFPARVPPGSTATIDARVRAPREPGRYRLLWDVAEEGRRWFTTEPGATLSFSNAVVTGTPVGLRDVGPRRPLPRGVVRPGRLALWRIAARMLAARPLLGVGPDNFRLLYGRYVDTPGEADQRLHTNDMYLEIAVGSGLIGASAFGWLLWNAARLFRCVLARARREPDLTAGVGLVAAGLAIALHGFVDSFLTFTPTYVLFAVTLGLAAGASRVPRGTDAHRV